jgi:hypothetical protein
MELADCPGSLRTTIKANGIAFGGSIILGWLRGILELGSYQRRICRLVGRRGRQVCNHAMP